MQTKLLKSVVLVTAGISIFGLAHAQETAKQMSPAPAATAEERLDRLQLHDGRSRPDILPGAQARLSGVSAAVDLSLFTQFPRLTGGISLGSSQ